MSDEKLIIPEYKINLLNKSKKIINEIENINKIIEIKKFKQKSLEQKGVLKKELKKDKKDIKKNKSKKKLRTLWVRKKKKG